MTAYCPIELKRRYCTVTPELASDYLKDVVFQPSGPNRGVYKSFFFFPHAIAKVSARYTAAGERCDIFNEIVEFIKNSTIADYPGRKVIWDDARMNAAVLFIRNEIISILFSNGDYRPYLASELSQPQSPLKGVCLEWMFTRTLVDDVVILVFIARTTAWEQDIQNPSEMIHTVVLKNSYSPPIAP